MELVNITKLVKEIERSNLELAVDICKAKGDGDIMKGLDWVKETYENRPFATGSVDVTYADLKVVIDVMEENLIK